MTGRNEPWTILGIGGESWTELETIRAARWVDIAKNFNKCVAVLNGGQSDIVPPESQTGSQVFADLLSYITYIRSKGVDKVIVCTMPAIGQGYSGYDIPTMDPYRFEYNNLIKAGNALIDGVVDLAAIPEMQDPTNVAYFYDTAHFTEAAATIAANAIRPVLVSVLATT